MGCGGVVLIPTIPHYAIAITSVLKRQLTQSGREGQRLHEGVGNPRTHCEANQVAPRLASSSAFREHSPTTRLISIRLAGTYYLTPDPCAHG